MAILLVLLWIEFNQYFPKNFFSRDQRQLWFFSWIIRMEFSIEKKQTFHIAVFTSNLIKSCIQMSHIVEKERDAKHALNHWICKTVRSSIAHPSRHLYIIKYWQVKIMDFDHLVFVLLYPQLLLIWRFMLHNCCLNFLLLFLSWSIVWI